jgi:putative sugar O-methyltransferase
MLWSQIRLARTKPCQVASFAELRKRFPDFYGNLKKHDISRFTTSLWEVMNARVEKVFLPYPPFRFLRDKTIRNTMFVTAGGKWLKEQTVFLESNFNEGRLAAILEEDYVGSPSLLNSKYLTSHQSIHHLYHFLRFINNTKCDLNQMDTIVEWGGGYGNMAKIFRRLSSSLSTYIIVDTPLFSCLQWLYLSTVFGEANVNLLQNSTDMIQSKKINLLPVCFVEDHKINADLFLSTWALSESSKYSQDYVVSHDWFEAKHILLAYQESSDKLPEAGRVGKLAVDSGAVIEDIEFLRGSHYAFR